MSEKSVKSRKSKFTAKKLVKLIKRKPIYFLGLLAIIAGSITLIGASAERGDCGVNSIVRCGGFNESTGSGPNQANFNNNAARHSDIDKIYDHYGIDDKKLGSLPIGEVRKDGTIWLNGQKVATNAISTGRYNLNGNEAGCKEGSRGINLGGGTVIYERRPCVSFRQSSLRAWVKLDANGKFKYAVITSCGNPTTGTPTYTPPPPPPPTGAIKCDAISVTKIDRVKFKINVKGSVSGAAKHVTFNLSYGDKTTDGRSPKGVFEHTYAKPGTYKIQGSNWGTLNGKTIASLTPACAATIKVDNPPTEKVPNFSIIKYVNGKDANDNGSAVSVKANEEFEYKVVVTNTGETKLTNVKVWDVLPAGVTYVDNTLKLDTKTVNNDSDFFNAAKGVVVPSIEIGKTATFTMKAVIKAEPSKVAEKCTKDGKFYNNVAKADPEGALPEKTDPAVVKCKETPKVDKPAVDIQKDVSKSEVEVGEDFSWFLKVTNTGDVDLKNVKVTDPAPANVDFISSPAVAGTTSTVTARKFEATIANLKVGQVVEFEIKSKVTAQVEGQIVNTACVDAPDVKDQGDNPDVDACDDAETKTKEEFCPVEGKGNLPKNSPECKTEKCPISGLEDYDASNPLCKNPPVVPEEIPSTGGGELVLMAAIALAIGVGVYGYTFRNTKKA